MMSQEIGLYNSIIILYIIYYLQGGPEKNTTGDNRSFCSQ